MSANWHKLRPYKNSQNSAFEELCCQLAEYEAAPPGARFIRKGTPDAGVECFWILPTGGEWGWQAKFLFPPFGSRQWAQLDESVYTALEHHPNLIRYTLCLPFDRSDPRGQKGKRSFLDQWNARVRKWETRTQKLEHTVQFNYWGDHEIATRLSKEEHAGRNKFWFDTEFLGQHWFEDHIREVVANAGDRYTPEVSVDLPIALLFDGLGRTPALFAQIDLLHKKLREAFRYLPSKELSEVAPDEAKELEGRMLALLSTLTEMRNTVWDPLPFEGLAGGEIKSTERCIEILQLRRDTTKGADAIAGPTQKRDFENQLFGLRRLLHSLYELARFAGGPCATGANKPALLIVGGAGSGKTHLLCDVAARRVRNGQPTVMLLGEQFGDAEPWKQLISLLKLNCTRDELLGALDAAAQAAGTRALIHIDALNEGAGEALWSKHLAGMLAHLENYPRLAIALSVRDSYERVVIPQQLIANRRIIREQHHGFREHEYEAVNRFFSYFGIEPSVPILYPEFSNPQFLLLFCKGLRNQGLSRIPTGLHGITKIFDFFLNSINDKLAHPSRLNFDGSNKLVQKATEQIAAQMARKATRALPLDPARKMIDSLLPDRQYDRSLSRHLVTEGVFAEDVRYVGTERRPERIVRFSYERFADHHIARLLLKTHLDRKHPEHSFKRNRPLGAFVKDDYSCWLNRGLLEALCIQVPEEIRKELPQLLPKSTRSAALQRQAFVDSLLWRDRHAFNDYTHKFINSEVLTYHESKDQFLNALLTLAPVPGHPFNADSLHRNLIRLPMADRDAWWSTFIHSQYGTQSAVDRLLEWPWSPLRAHKLDKDATILYATALAWLLSSSNRFLRDHATKSLVKLIGAETKTLLPLLERFQSVDDPYIVERICAVAYGCATKSQNGEQLQALATAVYNWIFASGRPDTHILIRDYARGVIEAALKAGARLQFDPDRTRPPYKSRWPKIIPSRKELETKHGWHRDQMPDREWARLSIYDSVMGFGDFARYVIGTNSGSFDWISTRLGKRPALTAKERHDRFLSNLNKMQKKAWEAVQQIRMHSLIATLTLKATRTEKAARISSGLVSGNELRHAEKTFEATLSPRELREYRQEVLTYVANPRADKHDFDLSLAQRWILQRVFDLGWSVEKFGSFDRDVNAHMWSRDAKKAERIGKKYQWIAYHQFLGLVADNFEFGNPLFDDSERSFEGPWQTYVRDIDPSCALRDIQGGDKNHDAWWSPRGIYRWESQNQDGPWIRMTKDLPSVQPLTEVSNPKDGSEWLVLESYPEWREPVPAFEEDFERKRRWLWYQVRSFLVERKNTGKVFSWLSKQHFWGRWMPENPEHHSIFIGEFYWAPALSRYKAAADPRETREPCLAGVGSPLVFTSGSYHSQMNSFDCSTDVGFSVFLPGGWIVKNMGLQWNGVEGCFFDSAGNLTAFDPAVSGHGPNALLIKRASFLNFLKESGYDVIWFVLGGKQELGRGWGRGEREGELQISGVFRLRGGRVSGELRPKFVSFTR
jgi:hypothetical protein